MKKVDKKLFIGALVAVLAFSMVFAAIAAETVSSTVTGNVISTLSIVKVANLVLGELEKAGGTTQGAGKTYTIAGTASDPVGASLAKFTIDGVNGANVTVELPATTTVTYDDGLGSTSTMTVDLKTNLATGAGNVLVNNAAFATAANKTGKLPNNALTFSVGGSVEVLKSSVNGAYTGSFSVNIDYND